MRQLSVIVLIALVAAASAAQNCSTMMAPPVNFYKAPMACMNDTAIAACSATYMTCATGKTCASACFTEHLRCMEQAAPATAACATWSTQFNNEKLYLAAGGDYNGSALMASCHYEVCAFQASTYGAGCAAGIEMTICADPMLTTVAPQNTAGATPVPAAPVGNVVVSFKIQGSVQEWTNMITTFGAAKLIETFVNPLLVYILGTDKFVVTGIAAGSLQIDFYMTDASASSADVQSKLETAATNGFDTASNPELAAAFKFVEDNSNLSASDLTVDATTIAVATATDTPAPAPTTGASSAAVVAAVAAVVAAMLF